MARPSSGGFILGFAAEIAIVVAAVSILPRVDLSGGRAGATTSPVAPARADWHETALWERSVPSNDRPAPASLPPRLSFTPPTASAPPEGRQPPPLIAVDPARPAYVEQRLDRASQSLVNGLGSYASQAAERLLREPAPTYNSPPHVTPLYPRQDYSPLPPAGAAGSFATQAAPSGPPRPWARY